ncbi:ATP synthase subunit I [Spirosoma sp. SC4-14]|uniref:ATP synthase subunit I n=1 Tax=Spirosoma sp. SC4-14 TaxID=3128900 RepID=UPI0030D22383
MNEILTLLLVGVGGVALGLVFYGGLWFTVRKGLSSTQPVLWFPLSLLVRLGVTAAGFYWLAAGHWENVLSCLGGFMLARLLVTQLTRRWDNRNLIRESEVAP